MSLATDYRWRLFSTAVGTLFLAAMSVIYGCAVAQIDVDVYKGPLVNEQDVQIEQTAAMAMGAKPLLVELRDKLEWGTQEARDAARASPWYRPGCITEYPPNPRLKDDLAIQVNEVLELYDDEPTIAIDALFGKAKAHMDDFKTATDKLNSLDYPLADRVMASTAPSNLPAKDFAHLRNAYAQFLTPDENGYRPAQQLLDAHVALWKSLSQSPADEQNYLPHGDPTNLDRTSTNGIYHSLENDLLIRDHAELLFPNDKVDQDKLVSIVTGIAVGFRTAREDEAALMDEALEMIKDRAKLSIPWQMERLVKGGSKMAAGLIELTYLDMAFDLCSKDNNPELENLKEQLQSLLGDADWKSFHDVSHNLAATTSPSSIFASATTLPAAASAAVASSSTTAARTALAATEPATRSSRDIDWLAEHDHQIRQRIQDLLTQDPDTYVKALEEAGQAVELGWSPEKEKWGIFRTSPTRRIYGIVSGPVGSTKELTEKFQEELAADETFVTNFGSTISGAFSGGRIEQGIERLMRDYSTMVNDAGAGASTQPMVLAARERMLVQLTHFAQKVLFVANYSILDEDEPDKSEATTTAPTTRESKGAQPYIAETNAAPDDNERAEDESRMLQAVGNSLITEINEIRAHEEASQAKDVQEELMAIAAARLATYPTTLPTTRGTPTTEMSYPPLCAALPSTLPTGYTRSDVIDMLRRQLRYEYDDMVIWRGINDPITVNYKNALTVLDQQYANSEYIRPPWFYLRNSYPVTSLESDTSSRWTNMLGRQVWRSIPNIEYMRDFFDSSDAKDALTNDEIDKTFWQNINRVRVAGTGNTNYVIVQDDIGNWYVKGYSADPKDIIQSAQQMASLAIGGPVSSAAISQALNQPASVPNLGKYAVNNLTPQAPAATQPSVSDTNVLQGEYNTSTTGYNSDVQNEYSEALTAARTLNDKLKSAWANDAATKSVATAVGKEADAIAAKELQATTQPTTQPSAGQSQSQSQTTASQLEETLRAMMLYGEKVSSQAYQFKDGSGTALTADVAAEVAKDVRDTVRTALDAQLGTDLARRSDMKSS